MNRGFQVVLPLLVLWLAGSSARNIRTAQRVAVDFYGEALCPFCMNFTNQVVAPMLTGGFSGVMEFR